MLFDIGEPRPYICATRVLVSSPDDLGHAYC